MNRRLFQAYLTQYLRALEDNDPENDDDENDDDDGDNYNNDAMSDDDDDDDDEEEIIYIRQNTSLRNSSRHRTQEDPSIALARKKREEEKERLFQEQLEQQLKALNEHDIAQTIRAHTGRYCHQAQSVSSRSSLSSNYDGSNVASSSLSAAENSDTRKKSNNNSYSGVNYNQDKSLVYLLHRRKIGGCTAGSLHRSSACSKETPGQLANIATRFLPSVNRGPIGRFDSYLFCGQFSLDGNFFMSACQDQTIRIYDVNTIMLKKSSISTRAKAKKASTTPTTNDSMMIDEDEEEEDEDEWKDNSDSETENITTNQQNNFANNTPVKHIKEIKAREVGWSIIDCNPSPDNKYLVYSSWSPYIHLASFTPPDYNPNENTENRVKVIERHEQLFLNPGNVRFCAFSVRFSPNGKEVLAGSNDDHLYLYDLEKNVRTERIHAHRSDINTVCYADTHSSNLFYSGSDDGLCKVWDRRQCSSSSSNAVGVLVGHSDGITCITSKGDGRYFISNGKDQTCKLWDIRKMSDVNQRIPQIPKSNNLWDYRYEAAPSRHARVIHPSDQSLMTYTGHHVLQTLIRCYFSPATSTGQQYIYTGSHDGIVYIYDILTGKIVKRLVGHSHIVRDVNWHPFLPILFSSSWDGTCLMWSHADLN